MKPYLLLSISILWGLLLSNCGKKSNVEKIEKELKVVIQLTEELENTCENLGEKRVQYNEELYEDMFKYLKKVFAKQDIDIGSIDDPILDTLELDEEITLKIEKKFGKRGDQLEEFYDSENKCTDIIDEFGLDESELESLENIDYIMAMSDDAKYSGMMEVMKMHQEKLEKGLKEWK